MEVVREFYKERRNELVRLISAEAYGVVVFLTFVRGKKEITIQFRREAFESLNVFGMMKEIQNYRAISWSDDAPNWCFMNRSKNGVLKFTQRKKVMRKVKELPWARKVRESEIEIDEFGPLEYRFGKWKGREVDVYKVWMDDDVDFLDRAMKAYRRLQDMNMTFDMLAHVVDDDDNIVGIMTEPMEGRCIEPHDWKLVFDSMRKLNDIGWILDAPHGGAMLVTNNGELRITAVHNVIELPKDSQKREERIRDREQFLAENVFMGMKNQCPSPKVVPGVRAKFSFGVKVMVPLSDPEKLLKGTSGKWIVEAVSSADHVGNVESLKLKRPLEVDNGDEEGEGRREKRGREDRPTKKSRILIVSRQGWPLQPERHETPLPPYVSEEEDLPLVPPSIGGVCGDNTTYPPPRVKSLKVASWIPDDLLCLALGHDSFIRTS
ncbi:hypothetical protein P691DRAFT_775417 [Macrolepiota fuliginosa MF-IS2]|uniref:Uncharacterized protein n=1 Tax=Macrolepiota fuliginosa MF-IS2 TaxID=1400762 RepID=A0A9P5XCZ3_9AGAR|nr:hypothetical protein P691DRAFT_775417 [Macrolepiota fuliginosa MF-IS2]